MHTMTMDGKAYDCECPMGVDHDENNFIAFIDATNASLEQYKDILLYDMKQFGSTHIDYDAWIAELEMINNILKHRKGHDI